MKYLFFLGSSLLIASPAMAADEIPAVPDPDNSITVLATGLATPVDVSAQPVAVVGADELQSIQGPDLTRTLERLPGVVLSRNGGLGSFTAMSLRGADAEQLLVLIDGVRVADVASPAGGYDLGNLLMGGIGKIELLRGSNSVVWGSQAMGGVLAVTSREINGLEGSIEGGSHATADAEVSAGISGRHGGFTLDGGFTRTDGIPTAVGDTTSNGYRQWRISARGYANLGESFSVFTSARVSSDLLGIDGFPPPNYTLAYTGDEQKTREISGLGGLKYNGGSLSLTADFAISDIRRDYSGPSYVGAPYMTQGGSERAELSGAITVTPSLRLDFGVDNEWSHFSTTYDARERARLTSGHALVGFHHGGVNLAAGVRLDDHSLFGSHLTVGANGSVDIGQSGWRVRASYGEGFKAPTLFQLLSDYGNSALRPETSRSYDIGIEKGDRNAPFHAAVSLFRRDSRDLIDFVSCFGVTTGICANRPFGTYDNVNRARAEGIEVEADGRPMERLTVHAAYSYIKATSRDTGLDLARRPRHAVSFSADWRTPLHDLTLGADVRAVSHSFDDAGNITRLDGYGLLTLRASLPVADRIEVYGRIENITGEHYQTAAGYGTPGRSAYAGVRARF